MKQNSHQRHCLNGHVVEDEELNICPVCGMPLYDQLQSDDSNNLEAQFNRFEPDESSRHNKNNIGYIILSTVSGGKVHRGCKAPWIYTKE